MLQAQGMKIQPCAAGLLLARILARGQASEIAMCCSTLPPPLPSPPVHEHFSRLRPSPLSPFHVLHALYQLLGALLLLCAAAQVGAQKPCKGGGKNSCAPTAAPSVAPSAAPTQAPSTAVPSSAPSQAPTAMPTVPTAAPTKTPTLVGQTYVPTTAPTTSPTTAPTTAPTAAPSLAPTVGCVVKDDDVCLQISPEWDATYTCASSTAWCVSWSKDMQRCCPDSCGTGALNEAECLLLPDQGTCTYPNGAFTSRRGFDCDPDAASTFPSAAFVHPSYRACPHRHQR